MYDEYDFPVSTTFRSDDPLRSSSAQFAKSGFDLLEQVREIGTQLGCQPANWKFDGEHDYSHKATGMPVLTTYIDGGRPDSVRQAAQQWANALGLVPSRKSMRGTIEFRGEIDGVKVRIWAVVDKAAFHGKFSAFKLYGPDLIMTGLFLGAATTAGVLLVRHRKLGRLAQALIR